MALSRKEERDLTKQRLAEWASYTEANPLVDANTRIDAFKKAHSAKKLFTDVFLDAQDAEDTKILDHIRTIPSLEKAFAPRKFELPLKVISSKNANAAILQPGESCLSLGHSFCALIVLTNGHKSFVAHTATAEEGFKDELYALRDQLGADVKAKIYVRGLGPQHLIEDTATIQKYTTLLEKVVSPDHLEQHTSPYISTHYLIAADGEVTPLTARLLNRLEVTHLPAQHTFKDIHSRQSIIAEKRGDFMILDKLPGHSIQSVEHSVMVKALTTHKTPI